MKVGVSSYSYSRYVSEGRLDIFGVVRTAAEMEFDGIEFSGLGPMDSGDDIFDRAKKLKDLCGELGLPITSYTIGANFVHPVGGTLEGEIDRVRGEAKVAAVLGAPRMRHDVADAPRGDNSLSAFIEVLPTLAKGCRGVTEFASDLGVKTMSENHGYFVQESERCAALIDAVGHPNYGSLIDIGNYLCADEEPLMAVARMAPRAFHVHAKDFHVKHIGADPGDGWFRTKGGQHIRGAIVGHGNVDVAGCVKLLKAAGFDGFLSIEFEGMEDNKQALAIGLANLRRYVASA